MNSTARAERTNRFKHQKPAPAVLAPRVASQAAAIRTLGRQLFTDAVKAGDLRECARKKGDGRDSVFYSVDHIRAVEDMVLAGSYPGGARK